MAVPVRVAPPVRPVVRLDELKAALRVDHYEDDQLIQAYERAAVAHLDGYRGVLGRCIRRQQWQVTYAAGGTHRLPFPDVQSVSATDAGGNPVAAELVEDALGCVVTLADAAAVTMTVQMPYDALAAVKQAVTLLVGHWYANREAVVTGTISTMLPLAVDTLLAPLRRIER